jgi:hypothetical protein
VSEDVAPARAGWYPLQEAAQGRPQVAYWDGAAWTGAQQRASRHGSLPRDTPGRAALILLCAGFVGTIAVPLAVSLVMAWPNVTSSVFTTAMIVDLAATPAALIVSIAGLVRGHELKFKTPLSLFSLVLSALGTVLFVLPIALFVTGVWSLHI